MLSPIIIAAHRERAKIIIVQQSTKRERESGKSIAARSLCFLLWHAPHKRERELALPASTPTRDVARARERACRSIFVKQRTDADLWPDSAAHNSVSHRPGLSRLDFAPRSRCLVCGSFWIFYSFLCVRWC